MLTATSDLLTVEELASRLRAVERSATITAIHSTC